MINHRKLGTAGAIAIGREPRYGDEYKSINQHIGEHRLSHANSSIEKTNNPYRTDRIYFADPEETVNGQTKKDHDYIIYDNRPVYPRLRDVRENYFNTQKDAENYGQYFKTIAEYYYRLEMADRRELEKLQKQKAAFQEEYNNSAKYKQELDEKSGDFPWPVSDIAQDKEKADYFFYLNSEKEENLNQKIGYYTDRIDHSKQQQKKAVQAFKIFDEVGLMFMERDGLRDRIRNADWYIPSLEDDIKKYTRELEISKNQKENLENQLKIAREWKALLDKKVNSPKQDFSYYPYYERRDKEYEDEKERAEAKAESQSYDKKIRMWEDKFKKLSAIVENKQRNLDYTKKNLQDFKDQLPIMKEQFRNKSEEIKSYYHKMEEFYNNNIEEWQY